MNTCARHPDLNHIEQGFEGHATFRHPYEIVNRKPYLLTGSNQPFDRIVDVFVMRLTESVKTLIQ